MVYTYKHPTNHPFCLGLRTRMEGPHVYVVFRAPCQVGTSCIAVAEQAKQQSRAELPESKISKFHCTALAIASRASGRGDSLWHTLCTFSSSTLQGFSLLGVHKTSEKHNEECDDLRRSLDGGQTQSPLILVGCHSWQSHRGSGS